MRVKMTGRSAAYRTVICILCAAALSVCLCMSSCGSDGRYEEKADGTLVSPTGVEYTKIADEGEIYYLGELEHIAYVKGEPKSTSHMGGSFQNGVYSIKGAERNSILVRYKPNNEFLSIYRESTLPALDISVDNCVRLEFVCGAYFAYDAAHASCGDGLVGRERVREFLSKVRAQQTSREAGLHEMITKPDGTLENCTQSACVYGFFDGEPNIVICMTVTSYNDLAYSIGIGGGEYVLTEELFSELGGSFADLKS